MAIVTFHAGIFYNCFIPIGEARIALFFIVSGFVLWLITAGRRSSPSMFLARRAARMIPLYWLVTTLVFVGQSFGVSRHASATVAQFVQSLLFLPHANRLGQIYPVLVPGWTLVYEMFFCVVFAGLLFLRESRRIWAATLIFGGLTVVGLILRPTAPVLATYTHPILLEFLAGIWLAHLWHRVRLTTWVAVAVLTVGVALSLVDIKDANAIGQVFVSGAPALLIIVGALALERPGAPPIRWLKLIGDSGYSIYLWHLPVLGAVAWVIRRSGMNAPIPSITLGVVAATICGLILYQVIEKPLTEKLFAWLDANSLRTTRATPAAARI